MAAAGPTRARKGPLTYPVTDKRRKRAGIWYQSPRDWKRLEGWGARFPILNATDPPDGWWQEEKNWRDLEKVLVELMRRYEKERRKAEELTAKRKGQLAEWHRWLEE